MKTHSADRRQFLRNASKMAAGVAGVAYLALPGKELGASNRIRVAIVGIHGQGTPWVVGFLCSEPLPKSRTCQGPAELEKAIANRPSAQAYNAFGAHFAQHNQISRAISVFENALRLNTKSWETRYNLGLALMQEGDHKRAARELRQVVNERPEFTLLSRSLPGCMCSLTFEPRFNRPCRGLVDIHFVDLGDRHPVVRQNAIGSKQHPG